MSNDKQGTQQISFSAFSQPKLKNLIEDPWFMGFVYLVEPFREFKQICMQDKYDIKAKPATSHKPLAHNQMNSLRNYKKFNDMLRSFELESYSENLKE
jgi:hypothetical protein